MNRIPVRSDEIVWRNLEGELVLLNPNSGKYYGMNAVGCSFWEQIDGKKTLAEIVDLLLAEYDVKREIIEKDIEELASVLEEKEIISLLV